MKSTKALKAEGLLRAIALVLSTLTALVVGLGAETKKVFFMERTADVHDLSSLWVLTIIASVCAAYHLLQLCRCLVTACFPNHSCGCNKILAWVCLLLDQGSAYVLFAGVAAAAAESLVAVTGVKEMQWGKLCNIYTRFCLQAGGSLACGLAAALAMAVVSAISAHHLFRLYPSYPVSFTRVARMSIF